MSLSWAIILGLFFYSVYQFIGAVWLLGSLIPFVLALPYIFAKDVVYAWKNADRFAAAERRRIAWEADIEKGIRQHREMFPEARAFDENGIPYDV